MWLFDIYQCAYSRDTGRRFSIKRREKSFPSTTIYTVTEEWHTPESRGNTGDWDYYTFLTYQDAAIFVAELILKLNSPLQNRLMRAAERFVTDITQNYKKLAKQAEPTPKTKPVPKVNQSSKATHQKPPRSDRVTKQVESGVQYSNMKRVYVFDMGNGTIKIGVSKNVETRRRTVMHHSGLFVEQYCYSELLPTKEALAIEQSCHSHFADRNTLSEFFAVSFAEAKTHLQTYTPVIEPNENNSSG